MMDEKEGKNARRENLKQKLWAGSGEREACKQGERSLQTGRKVRGNSLLPPARMN